MKVSIRVFISVSLLIGAFFFGTAAFAASSTNYFITAEVIDLGGAIKTSTNYNLISKLREMQLSALTSNSYSQETTFVGLVYGSGSFSTFEVPTISSVAPAAGFNDRSYRVIVNGSNISTDATIQLTRAGQTAVVGTTITYTDMTSVECDLDLNGVESGLWNLVVTNVGWHSAYSTLVNGFSITSPGEMKLMSAANDPNPFNPEVESTHIKYKLSRTGPISLYLFNQKGELIWQKNFATGDNGGSVDNDVLWNGVTDFTEEVPTGVYVLKIVSRAKGVKELGRIKIAVLRQ
jgi:hypothetical protein